MGQRDEYTAKEAFTFPIFCIVCLILNIYWGCTDEWTVGAIIGTSFFGMVILSYIGIYSRFGRNYLKINTNGIEIKELGQITTLKWSDIKKCEVYYRTNIVGFSIFARDLYIVAKSATKRKQYVNVSLSGKYCQNKSVINAIKRFGGTDVFDRKSSRRQNKYLAGILLIAIIVLVLTLLYCEYQS